jgi:hypothetical protein
MFIAFFYIVLLTDSNLKILRNIVSKTLLRIMTPLTAFVTVPGNYALLIVHVFSEIWSLFKWGTSSRIALGLCMNIRIYFQICWQTRQRSPTEKWKIFPLYLILLNLLRRNRVFSSPRINQWSKPTALLAAIATLQALATLEHWQCCHSRALFVEQKLICCPVFWGLCGLVYKRSRKNNNGKQAEWTVSAAFFIQCGPVT